MSADNPVVGWGTTEDGKRVPIRQDFAEALFAAAEAAKAKRVADMPTELAAILALHSAYVRLQDFGWRDPIYAPKDGSLLDIIEAGSTGIHVGNYQGEWPTGSWWIHEPDDMSPTRPTLARAHISTPKAPKP